MAALTRGLEEVARDLGHGLSQLGEAIEGEIQQYSDRGEQDFQRTFRLPSNERLHAVYSCRVLNGDVGVGGVCYVSANHVCFVSSDDKLKIVIPFVAVVAIEQAVGVKKQGSGAPTFVYTCDDALAEAIRVYTNDQKVHTFWSDPLVLSGPLHHRVTSFSRWRALLIGSWRAQRTSRQASTTTAPATATTTMDQPTLPTGQQPDADACDAVEDACEAKLVEEDGDNEEEEKNQQQAGPFVLE